MSVELTRLLGLAELFGDARRETAVLHAYFDRYRAAILLIHTEKACGPVAQQIAHGVVDQ